MTLLELKRGKPQLASVFCKAMVDNTQRAPTYGEKAVGLTFNPSNDPKVQEVKELFAKIIDIVHELPVDTMTGFPTLRNIILTGAVIQSIRAQMEVVKAITWKD